MTFREKKVLAFVNDIRADLGLDTIPSLLPGKRRRAGECPIANSIAYGDETEGRAVLVTRREIAVCDQNVKVVVRVAPTDEALESWIRDFDAGHFPEMAV